MKMEKKTLAEQVREAGFWTHAEYPHLWNKDFPCSDSRCWLRLSLRIPMPDCDEVFCKLALVRKGDVKDFTVWSEFKPADGFSVQAVVQEAAGAACTTLSALSKDMFELALVGGL